MLLNLMGEDEKLPVAGRVIWLTPKGAQGKRTAGIGVQFSDQDRGQTQKKIETYLAGALAATRPLTPCSRRAMMPRGGLHA
jgi:type IV pilus assembly protein PilZ